MEQEIRFEVAQRIGRITLDRPKALNALTLDQIHAMAPMLRRWSDDESVGVVVIRGTGGKAFCAGGDVRSLYDARERGDRALLAKFYRHEYQLDRLIKTYPKPYVAILDGIVMGGGVGISVHGSHRVATEGTVFAMPETGIGLFPDVGGSWFLPRMPGQVGMYLALTGARLTAADALYAGVATHYVRRERLADLDTVLGRQMANGSTSAVDDVLAGFHEDPGPPALAERRGVIDRCFDGKTLSGIFGALNAEGSDWARATLKTLATKAPLSLAVTFRQMHEGARLGFDEAMRMEYRLSQRFMNDHDFFEGVRALLIDKDNTPRWCPARLEEVTAEMVDAYFAPFEAGEELTFDS